MEGGVRLKGRLGNRNVHPLTGLTWDGVTPATNFVSNSEGIEVYDTQSGDFTDESSCVVILLNAKIRGLRRDSTP